MHCLWNQSPPFDFHSLGLGTHYHLPKGLKGCPKRLPFFSFLHYMQLYGSWPIFIKSALLILHPINWAPMCTFPLYNHQYKCSILCNLTKTHFARCISSHILKTQSVFHSVLQFTLYFSISMTKLFSHMEFLFGGGGCISSSS